MHKTQCLVAFAALCVGLAHSWEIAVSAEDRLEFYINDTKTATIRLDSHNPAALAYDEVDNMLLYVDKQSGNDAICGYNMSFSENKCFTKGSGRDIQGLAYDPITQTLFFTDMKEKSINWLSLKPGSNNSDNGNVLIKLDEGIPTDIAVDSCRGYIYWINTYLVTSSIERARFNGSDREVVIYAKYKLDLHSLAIGQQTKQIYWIMPMNSTRNDLYSADLNGKNMILQMRFTNSAEYSKTHPNILSVSKKNVYVLDWCANCLIGRSVWKFPKPSIPNVRSYLRVNTTHKTGLVANYKISEQFDGIQECQSLTSRVPDHTLNCREYEGPFCVHGAKVNGQSLCKCSPGYKGERCDISVCENYCLHGECSYNDEGLPSCRCKPGYKGDRCEVDSCYGYCSNNGTCSLNADNEPVCQCIYDYAGDRCEVADCLNYCIQGQCSLSSEGLPECRCKPGYTGDRCEVDSCHEYCSNNGTCSLNADNEPVCQCIDDFAGDRCEVADCLNYCIQGQCSLSSEGLPECRCNVGYTGVRCEVNSCLGFCLNNGSCSINEGEPLCECPDDYSGDRCEFDNSFMNVGEDQPACQCAREDKTKTLPTTPYYPALRNITLADLFANWRKPAAIIPVFVVDLEQVKQNEEQYEENVVL